MVQVVKGNVIELLMDYKHPLTVQHGCFWWIKELERGLVTVIAPDKHEVKLLLRSWKYRIVE